MSPRLTYSPTPERCYLLSFFMVFYLSLENPLACVFHGKERVIPVGFLTVVNVIVRVYTITSL